MEPVTRAESHLQHWIDKLIKEQQRTNELLLQLIEGKSTTTATTTRKRKAGAADVE